MATETRYHPAKWLLHCTETGLDKDQPGAKHSNKMRASWRHVTSVILLFSSVSSMIARHISLAPVTEGDYVKLNVWFRLFQDRCLSARGGWGGGGGRVITVELQLIYFCLLLVLKCFRAI